MNVIVVGIHDGHNASAAVIKDGELVSAVQEERFTGVKNQGGFPQHAIAGALELAKLRPRDVTAYAVADCYKGSAWRPNSPVEDLVTQDERSRMRSWVAELPATRRLQRARLGIIRRRNLSSAGLAGTRFSVFDHHHCHAAAAYYSLGSFDEKVLVLTADSAGDQLCASVSIGSRGTLKRIASIPDLYSLGGLYTSMTYLLGMMPMDHEYKVMGLAPYAEKSVEHVERVRRKLEAMFEFDWESLTWRTAKNVPTIPNSLAYLKDVMYRERFDWLAGGLQAFLEDTLLSWVSNCINRTGIRNVALGGGVFMNVKANKRILELPGVESLFPMPSSGDESNCIGAAFSYYAEHSGCFTDSKAPCTGTPEAIVPLSHLYLGPTITDDEARAAIESSALSHKLRWDRSTAPEREVAELLAAGNIVARAVGHMEFGARALGNRSILADASRPDVVRIINDMIKGRDFWMPFAPSMIQDRSSEYVHKDDNVLYPYMTIAFDSRVEKRDVLKAACHPSDHTVRIQEVRQDWNPRYYALIEHFSALSGEAVVLNTSFNLHGYPIVRTAEEALAVLCNSGLQYLQVANYIVEKIEP